MNTQSTEPDYTSWSRQDFIRALEKARLLAATLLNASRTTQGDDMCGDCGESGPECAIDCATQLFLASLPPLPKNV